MGAHSAMACGLLCRPERELRARCSSGCTGSPRATTRCWWRRVFRPRASRCGAPTGRTGRWRAGHGWGALPLAVRPDACGGRRAGAGASMPGLGTCLACTPWPSWVGGNTPLRRPEEFCKSSPISAVKLPMHLPISVHFRYGPCMPYCLSTYTRGSAKHTLPSTASLSLAPSPAPGRLTFPRMLRLTRVA